MAEETKPTESAAPSGGDLPTAESPAPEPASENGETQDQTDYKRLYLDSKTKIEEANRILRERQESEARHTPAADAQPEAVAKYRQEVYTAAQQGVGWAQDLVESWEDQREITNVLRVVVDSLPADRKEALKEYAQNRSKYGTLEAAQEAISARKLREENTRLQAELKRATANRVDPNIPETGSREGANSSPKAVETMTRADWQQRQSSLSQDERMAEQRKRLNGEIVIRG